MNLATKYPTAVKFLTTLAGIVMAVASQPDLSVRQLVAMLGTLLAGVGVISVKGKES